MVIIAIFLVVTPFKTSPVGCAVALIGILIGLPVYYVFVASKIVPPCCYNAMGKWDMPKVFC